VLWFPLVAGMPKAAFFDEDEEMQRAIELSQQGMWS
jgi:hypothetical protein